MRYLNLKFYKKSYGKATFDRNNSKNKKFDKVFNYFLTDQTNSYLRFLQRVLGIFYLNDI